jgi:stress response protein SCP2
MNTDAKVLIQGQRVSLKELTTSPFLNVEIILQFPLGTIVDMSCFGLDGNGKLSDERYFQFYNQKKSPCGSIQLLDARKQNQQEFALNLEKIPTTIERLVFVASIDGQGRMSDLLEGRLRLLGNGKVIGLFSFSGSLFAEEKALLVGEVYRREHWRFSAIGQGFSGGLDAVLRHFGGIEAVTPPATANEIISSSPPAAKNNRPFLPVFTAPWHHPGPMERNGKKVCRRCNRVAGLIGGLRYNNHSGRCAGCESEEQRRLIEFRHQFLHIDNDLNTDHMNEFDNIVHSLQLDINEAWAFVRGDVLAAIERQLEKLTTAEILDETHVDQLYKIIMHAQLPEAVGMPLIQQIQAGLIHTAQIRFRRAFVLACEDAVITEAEWQNLKNLAQQERLNWNLALESVRAESLRVMQRTLAIFAADGEISDEEYQSFYRLQQQLMLSDSIMKPLTDRINELRTITRIRQGHLPVIDVDVHLESNEICHLDTAAIYRKVTARTVIPISGRLIATNKQLNFLSPTSGGWKIKLKSIMRVYQQGGAIHLELSNKTGNGRYELPDAPRVEAIIDALVRMDKRLLLPQSDNPTRHIPHDVRLAVWQRDQGRCSQCQATDYLEYDHIIPHSRGGANTINNVQLLCRRCNLAKGDRI